MISIKNELIEKLSSYDGYTFKPKVVRDFYTDEKPVFPMVIIDEVVNDTFQSIHGKEIYSNIGYRVECYGKDTAIGETIYTKTDIAFELGVNVDKFMQEQMGFKRVGSPVMIPSVDDSSVVRYVLTYSGIINVETQLIYKI